MHQTDYDRFTDALLLTLSGIERVIGLVALGSMARSDYQPDDWSDHDFFVITEHGAQESMRKNLDWLPRAGELILHFRETEHGLKALYRGGHLLEFAVFDEVELQVAKVNRYRVLLDRGDITSQMAELARATLDRLNRTRTDASQRFAELLMNVIVGVGRHARGEKLSGRQFIGTHALTHLLRLLAESKDIHERQLTDNLDPFRRFERTFPAWGTEINDILAADTLGAAEGILSLAVRVLRPSLPGFPEAAFVEVQQLIAKAKRNAKNETEKAGFEPA